MVKEFWRWAKPKLFVDKELILTYCVIYFTWGLGMNWVGQELEIARFTFWWQVITCYILYMVPISLLLRGLPFHQQYAYGLIAMAFWNLEGMPWRPRMPIPITYWTNFSTSVTLVWVWPFSSPCIFLWAMHWYPKYMHYWLNNVVRCK